MRAQTNGSVAYDTWSKQFWVELKEMKNSKNSKILVYHRVGHHHECEEQSNLEIDELGEPIIALIYS